jgi:hypothetical protein
MSTVMKASKYHQGKMLAMSPYIVTRDLAACIAAICPRSGAASVATISPKKECLGV